MNRLDVYVNSVLYVQCTVRRTWPTAVRGRLIERSDWVRTRFTGVVGPNCWIFRACFKARIFQQDFRSESYGELSSCWIPVLQILAISWNSVLSKRSLDRDCPASSGLLADLRSDTVWMCTVLYILVHVTQLYSVGISSTSTAVVEKVLLY